MQGKELVPVGLKEIDYLRNEGFDFFLYREVFERLVCEGHLRDGLSEESSNSGLVQIRLLPSKALEAKPPAIVGEILGVNRHSEARIGRIRDFFEDWEAFLESQGVSVDSENASGITRFERANIFTPGRDDMHKLIQRYLKRGSYLDTSYFVRFADKLASDSKHTTVNLPRTRYIQAEIDKVTGGAASRALSKRLSRSVAKNYITMLENLRAAGGLTHNSKSNTPSQVLTPTDIPWAIQYPGHLKYRDGAHRRATLAFLGHENLPHLVFLAERAISLSSPDSRLSELPDYQWAKFRCVIQKVADLA